MGDTNLLNEIKDEILERVQKDGFISLEDLRLRDRGLEKEEFNALWSWIEEQKIDVVSPDEAYRRKLPTLRAKISFCYYELICYFLNVRPDVTKYKRNVVFKQRAAVDHYLKVELNDDEIKIVKIKFGLETGEPCWNEEEIFKRSGIKELDMFIYHYTHAEKKLDVGPNLDNNVKPESLYLVVDLKTKRSFFMPTSKSVIMSISNFNAAFDFKDPKLLVLFESYSSISSVPSKNLQKTNLYPSKPTPILDFNDSKNSLSV